MGWLFFQTLIWILLAFVFGLLMGWLLRGIICRDKDGADAHQSSGAATTAAVMREPDPAPNPVAVVQTDESLDIQDDMRPVGLSEPNGDADDLKRISGVGPVIQDTLNGLGIYHFQQIADFTQDNINWVDNHISFPGRIQREGWVSQAKDLASGVDTEFSGRYDKGEVGEDNPNT